MAAMPSSQSETEVGLGSGRSIVGIFGVVVCQRYARVVKSGSSKRHDVCYVIPPPLGIASLSALDATDHRRWSQRLHVESCSL